jgi:hypothetical protein
VKRHDRVMRLAARRDEFRILDLEQQLLESNELVRLSLKQPSERGQLNSFLLQRAVRKEPGHCRDRTESI